MTFKQWITENHNYTTKAANDVTSRRNRVHKLIDFIDSDSQESVLDSLAKNKEFQTYSDSIKSQLRKSVKLHFEFLESQLTE